ncbi:unnamed protein product [Mytilus edulis]|uniref:Endonuclease/exonuclease/phosphatase domain-containing protein n=1 Tax=Mytilus edulis TaxID=6550 RepID=A0A8S3Q676_MYTED|nr:unnamed protein product [Mytilus edulis]
MVTDNKNKPVSAITNKMHQQQFRMCDDDIQIRADRQELQQFHHLVIRPVTPIFNPPPSFTFEKFMRWLTKILTSINRDIPTLIAGDFNINLLETSAAYRGLHVFMDHIHFKQGYENRILIAQNVRSTVTCTECDKPRCVYSTLKLTPRDVRALKHTIEKYDYTCGAILAPEVMEETSGEDCNQWLQTSVIAMGKKYQTLFDSFSTEAISLTEFKKLWLEQCPQIVLVKPATDLCSAYVRRRGKQVDSNVENGMITSVFDVNSKFKLSKQRLQ